MPDIIDEPQYQQAIAGIQGMLTGGVPRRADPDEQDEYVDSIKEMLVMQGLEESAPKKAEKKGFNPLALIPGYAQGLMQRQAYDQKNEYLKLEQQRQKGIAADRQLKLQKELADIKLRRDERAQRKTLGTAVRLLQEGGLDEQSQRELQGQIGQGVAQIGDAGDILRAQEGAQEQAAQRVIAGLDAEPSAAEPAGAPAPQPDATPPPAGRQPLAIRNNNPGNIKLGPETQRYVDAGLAAPAEAATDGGRFLKFRDQATGAQAMQELLSGPVYRDLSVDAALRKWSNRGYGANIVPGIAPNTLIRDLSPQQLAYVQQRMAQVEAGSSGSQAPAPVAGAPPQTDTPALAQDRVRLRMLEARLGMLDRRRARLLPLAHTKHGKPAYDNVQQDYTQTVSEINALRTRLYEQGPEKFERELQKARQTGLEGAQTAAERTRLVEEAKTQAERNRTLGEVEKDRATRYRDKTTGEPVDITQPYIAALEAVKPKGPAVLFTKQQEDQWNEVEAVIPVVTELRDAVERVYGPGGIFENLSPEDRIAASLQGVYERFRQTNPDLAIVGRLIESNVDIVRRALQGQRGTQTEQDAVRGIGTFAKTKGIPDSQAVAYALTNAFQTMIERGQAAMLRNPDYINPNLRLLGPSPHANVPVDQLTPKQMAEEKAFLKRQVQGSP